MHVFRQVNRDTKASYNILISFTNDRIRKIVSRMRLQRNMESLGFIGMELR